MRRWFVPAVLAAVLINGGSAATSAAAMVPAQAQQHQSSSATDLGARRHVRHQRRDAGRRSYQVYDRYYFDRPRYYAPAPFFPFLGVGYGPWW